MQNHPDESMPWVIRQGPHAEWGGASICWTLHMLESFKKVAAEHAKGDSPKEPFLFEGNEYLPGYTKHLIQFLESRLQ